MKIIYFILSLGLFPTICLSQNIDSAITLQDGTVVDCSHAFLDGEMPTFHLQNGESENIKWEFCIYNENGEKVKATESELGSKSFGFKVTPELLPTYGCECKTIEFPNDSSVYVCGVVDLYKNGILIDNVSVLLNVLPSRPKVKNISIHGNFDYQDYGYTPLAQLTISFVSYRMDYCRLLYFSSDSVNVFQFPTDHTLIIQYMDTKETSKGNHELIYDSVDWGEFYTITSCNKYGSTNGDTICTTDGITDSQIHHFLDNLQNQIMPIENELDNNCQIVISNNIMTLGGCTNMNFSTDIYSINGTLIHRSQSVSEIDLNDFASGMYIVKFKSNNILLTKKIIKL